MKITIDTADPRLREVLQYELLQIKGDVSYRIDHQLEALRGFARNFPVIHSPMSGTAPYAPGSSTSKAAAKKIAPKLTGLRLRVLDYIDACGMKGATGSEIAAALDINLYSAKPRCTELRDAGYIREGGIERDNRHGNAEIVWITKNPARLTS